MRTAYRAIIEVCVNADSEGEAADTISVLLTENGLYPREGIHGLWDWQYIEPLSELEIPDDTEVEEIYAAEFGGKGGSYDGARDVEPEKEPVALPTWDIDTPEVDPDAVCPRGIAQIEGVWGYLPDGGLSEPRNFVVDVGYDETIASVWAKLEEMVRQRHERYNIHTRHYYLEKTHTSFYCPDPTKETLRRTVFVYRT